MAIANFLNPTEEDEQELKGQELDPEAVLQGIIAEHLGLQQEDEDNKDSEQPRKPEHSIQSARQALQVVIEFTKGRDDVKTARLRAIELLEQELEAIDISSCTQTTLDSWII